MDCAFPDEFLQIATHGDGDGMATVDYLEKELDVWLLFVLRRWAALIDFRKSLDRPPAPVVPLRPVRKRKGGKTAILGFVLLAVVGGKTARLAIGGMVNGANNRRSRLCVLLSGCGLGAKLEARDAMIAARSDYDACLKKAASPDQCASEKARFDADWKAYLITSANLVR